MNKYNINQIIDDFQSLTNDGSFDHISSNWLTTKLVITNFLDESKFNLNHNKYDLLCNFGSAQLFSCQLKISKLPSILLVPSLINRYYILDFDQQRSLIKYLLGKQYNVFILVWNEPNSEELNFQLEDYITKRLLKAVEYITENINQAVNILGHCLGGLLALASCFLLKSRIKSLILISTPWDFGYYQISMTKVFNLDLLTKFDRVPAKLLQAFFYFNNLNKILAGFENFKNLSFKRQSRFIKIHHWSADGISITKPLLIQLVKQFINLRINLFNKWQINQIIIDPARLDIPIAMFSAINDNIVPIDSVISLAKTLNIKIKQVRSGHLGILIGKQAKQALYQPIGNWLNKINYQSF